MKIDDFHKADKLLKQLDVYELQYSWVRHPDVVLRLEVRPYNGSKFEDIGHCTGVSVHSTDPAMAELAKKLHEAAVAYCEYRVRELRDKLIDLGIEL